jgi:hypothetical protein
MEVDSPSQVYFASLLTPGLSLANGPYRFSTTVNELGVLCMPTGVLVMRDVLVETERPFVVTMAPGRYPVVAHLADIQRDGWQGWTDRRVLALELRVRPEPATTWELALSRDDSSLRVPIMSSALVMTTSIITVRSCLLHRRVRVASLMSTG